MNVVEWVVLGVYVLGYAGFTPVLARVLAAWATIEHEPTREDRVLGVLFALLAGLFWPLVILGAWVYKRAFPEEVRRER